MTTLPKKLEDQLIGVAGRVESDQAKSAKLSIVRKLRQTCVNKKVQQNGMKSNPKDGKIKMCRLFLYKMLLFHNNCEDRPGGFCAAPSKMVGMCCRPDWVDSGRSSEPTPGSS